MRIASLLALAAFASTAVAAQTANTGRAVRQAYGSRLNDPAADLSGAGATRERRALKRVDTRVNTRLQTRIERYTAVVNDPVAALRTQPVDNSRRAVEVAPEQPADAPE